MLNHRLLTKSIHYLFIFLCFASFKQGEAKIYQSDEFQIDFPDNWSTSPILWGLKGYTFLSLKDFIAVEVSTPFISSQFINNAMNSVSQQATQEEFKKWLFAAYEKYLDNMQMIQIDVVQIGAHKYLHVNWMGTVKSSFFLRDNPGQTIYFSQYFLPNSQSWLRSFLITGFSSCPNPEVQMDIQSVAETLVLK